MPRIYDKALTLNEIKELVPNELSEIKPFAWWSFEDDASEQTGRFPHHELRIGASVKNGKLMLHRGAVLIAAKSEETARRGSQVPLLDEPYVPETPKMPIDPPDNWPIYHLFHPDVDLGAPYDPNSRNPLTRAGIISTTFIETEPVFPMPMFPAPTWSDGNGIPPC